MLITPATLEALKTTFSLEYQKAYDVTETWWEQIATLIPSSSKSNTYGWVEKILALRKWVGARQAANLTAHSYVLANEPYEGTVEVDRDDIEDDNLGVYTNMIMPGLGQAVKKHPDQLIADLLTANTAKAYDGLPLFDHGHTLAGQAYDNDNSLLLTPDNFSTVWAKMVSIKGEDGKPLGVMPNTLFHAPQLRKTALEILNSTLTAKAITNVAGAENVGGAAVDNVLKGWANPVMLEELSGTPNAWFLADTRKPIKPLVYQMRREAQFVARDNPQDPKVFDLKKFTYGTEGRWAIGITLPFLIARGHA